MLKLLFLEGPAYAGKTTFLNQLPTGKGIHKLVEASEFLGGDSNFPEAPHDVASMVYCSYFFSFMENKRLKSLGHLADDTETLVVADRFTPLSSLIFYFLRYKGGFISRSDYLIGIQLSAAIFRHNLRLPAIPSRLKFLLFDVSSEAEFSKRLPRGARNADFNSWQNFQLLEKAYTSLLPADAARVINGGYDARDLEIGWVNRPTLLDELLHPANFLFGDLVGSTLMPCNLNDNVIYKYISKREISAIEHEIESLAIQ